MSRDGSAALPRDVMGLSVVVIVVFPDHTHLLFLVLRRSIIITGQ